MFHILSNRDQRYLLILETLFNSHSQTLGHLAKLTETSKRNLQNDITTINEFIDPMYIATSLKEGCTLIYPDTISIDYLYQCILKNSLEFSLFEAVFFEKKERLEDYADYLFISVSTLKRMIQKINKAIAHLNFQITTGPVQLVGNESLITSTMIMYFLERYRFDKLPFSRIQMKTLDTLISSVIRKQEKFYNFPDLLLVKLILLVAIVRLQHHHLGKLDLTIPEEFDISFANNFFLRQAFKSIFRIELDKQTLIRLFYPFITGKFAFDYDHLMSLAQDNPETLRAVTLMDDFLQSLSQEFQLPLANKEQLLLELFNVYHLNVGESYLLYNKKKVFLDNFLENAPQVTDFLARSIQKASNLDKNFEAHEIEQLAYIFITHWDGFAKSINKLKQRFSIGVFMDSDFEHSEFIAATLNDRFKDELEFQVIQAATVTEFLAEANNFVFVITNMSDFPSKSVPLLCIQLYPSSKDFQRIADFYSTITYLSHDNGAFRNIQTV